MKTQIYKIKERVWLYPDEHAMDRWHFVDVGKKVSKEIKETYGAHRRGFGSVPVVVTVGKTSWKTSLFPDRKRGGYILPLKADARKKEGIKEGIMLAYTIQIR